MPRNDPNRVLRISSDATVNARDYTMVLANATAAPVALILITPAAYGEWSIKVKNVGTGNDVTLSVAGGGSFTFTLPAGAACEITQDDLGVLHVFGSTNGTSGTFSMETPTGAVDGVNDTFVFTTPPIQVFYKGVLQNGGDYVLTGSVATFTVPPVSGSVSGLVAS
jgi:hypothetical protein